MPWRVFTHLSVGTTQHVNLIGVSKLKNALMLTVLAFSMPFAHAGTDVRATASAAQLNNNYPDSTIFSVSAQTDVSSESKLGVSLTNVNAWGAHAEVMGLRYLTSLSPSSYADINFAASDAGKITIKDSMSAMLNFKTLPAGNLVLGGGLGRYTMRGGGEGLSASTQAVYYASFAPVVLQGNYSIVQSKMNSRYGYQGGVAATYGHVGSWTASAQYSAGRAHYELVMHPGAIADYNSESYGLAGSYWMAPNWGLTAGTSRVSNKYYTRDEVSVGVFYSF
jgi:YaiO family outer membrane protein